MPRIMIKGVIWNKIQDDILKAGVMRYGNNQWERIIPLLPGKTAKQCKDRWEIGLSQSARKTQWTPREDDKLQRLATLMPAKWQNIASIIGRTAVDCFNRYDCLLAREQKRKPDDDDDDDDDKVVHPKKIVPGGIYRNAAGKPGFADLNRSFENGLEAMMSAARAKLASAQARKAKLLAREKRLEVARRFASMRRHRERVRARLRAEEMNRRAANLEAENSSDSNATSCCCYSSANPLTEMFLDMQQGRASVELRTREADAEQTRDERHPREIPESVRWFLAEDAGPATKRRKVIVLHEPSIGFEELQQVVELRRHFDSSGHIAFGRSFTELIVQESCKASASVRETPTEINEMTSNDDSRGENNNYCVQPVV